MLRKRTLPWLIFVVSALFMLLGWYVTRPDLDGVELDGVPEEPIDEPAPEEPTTIKVAALLVFSPVLSHGQEVELRLVGEPQVFAPGVISLPESNDEYLSLSPNGEHAVFTRREGRTTHLWESRLTDAGWIEPELVSFSGDFNDNRGTFSPDGSQLFFASDRPSTVGTDPSQSLEIWVVDRTAVGWGKPRRLGPAVNGDQHDTHPAVARSGNLYFVRWGDTETDIYVAEWTGDGYAEARPIGHGINTEGPESHPYVDPDERFLIFTPTDREGDYGGGDIYVSYRTESGWTAGANLGPPVSTEWYEYSAKVTPDGRLMFSRAGFGEPEQRPADLYVVDLEIRSTGR